MFKGSEKHESQVMGDEYGRGSSAEDLVISGEEAFAAGNYQEAEQFFKKALHLAPFNAKIHNNLSVVYWGRGDTDKSLLSLTQALETDPDDQDVILNCAEVFQKLGRINDAREILESYLEKKPWDDEVKKELERLNGDLCAVSIPTAAHKRDLSVEKSDATFVEEGERQFERKNLTHAEACFKIALEHNPKNPKAHSNLGVVFWQKGETNLALDHLRLALDLDSEDPDILYNSAKVLIATGEKTTGADMLRFYLQRNPKDEEAWNEYQSILRGSDGDEWQPEGLSTDAADIYVRLGQELFKAGDVLGAGQSFLRALRINPNHAEAYHQLGALHRSMGQISDAVKMLKEALKINTQDKSYLLALGEMLASAGKNEEASDVYRNYLSSREDQEVQDALDKLAGTIG